MEELQFFNKVMSKILIDLMVEAVSASETSVNFYWIT
jgi:hypothetical protein